MTNNVTPPVPRVYAAISAVMAHMAKEGISKDRKNHTQGYSFRGIDDMYNALASVMAANKLIILPFVQNVEREERATQKGGMLNYTILTVDFKFVSAEDGSFDIVRMVGEAMDSGDKSSNKSHSAALKYAAMEVFLIPTEGDNDADAVTHDVAPRQRREPTQTSGAAAKVDAAEPPEGFGDWTRAKIVEIARTKDTYALDVLLDSVRGIVGPLKAYDAEMFKSLDKAFRDRRAIFAGEVPA